MAEVMHGWARPQRVVVPGAPKRLFDEARQLTAPAQRRASVERTLLALADAGSLRLTDVLCESEPCRTYALEVLTHTESGRPVEGVDPFADVRWRFVCRADKPRQYKIGVDRLGTDKRAGTSYAVLTPIYVEIAPGAIIELAAREAAALLDMYGAETTEGCGYAVTAKRLDARPWYEVGQVTSEMRGEDAESARQLRKRATG